MASEKAKEIAEAIKKHIVTTEVHFWSDCIKEHFADIIDQHLEKKKSCEHDKGSAWYGDSKFGFKTVSKTLKTDCPFCEKEVKKEWCEHIRYDLRDNIWLLKKSVDSCMSLGFDNRVKFCPICGAPRPNEEDLIESMSKKLLSAYDYAYDHLMTTKGTPFQREELCKRLAQEAINFLREKGRLRKGE